MQGKVANYFHDKGFGFIQADGHEDNVFFHRSYITDDQVQCRPGELVEFDLTESQVKPGQVEASNVRLAEGYVPPKPPEPTGPPTT